ncbi:DNA-binding HxlR family transcriptional regulator [Conyzicola nivalis]|uniref:DNA-binding HxlR family transcriptional regulator n=1 Tax=Conyzicola nivalis TaxID=1477021 RepID=A0ABV2QK39_9MICO
MSTAQSPRCSVARSLEVLGEKWTLLVVREAFWGATRFSEFKSTLSVASDILTNRLATLVDAGVLERRAYREDGARERSSYHLTESGLALRPVLAALTQWGDAFRPSGFGPAAVYRERESAAPVRIAFVSDDGRVIEPLDVEVVRGGAALEGAPLESALRDGALANASE